MITQHSTPTSRKSITAAASLLAKASLVASQTGAENCTESIENLDPWTLLRDDSMILSAVADSAAIPFPTPDSSSLRQLAEREATEVGAATFFS